MDKSLFLFIAIGIGFLYLITNFVGDIQKEDDKYQNSAYQQKHQYDQYQSVDSIGQTILDLTQVDLKRQVDAWNASILKDEFLNYFPDFSAMKTFAKERIRGEKFQVKLIKNIDRVEGKYISGEVSAEAAKRELVLLK